MFHVCALRPWKRIRQTGCVAAATRGATFVARGSRASTETYESPCSAHLLEPVAPLLHEVLEQAAAPVEVGSWTIERTRMEEGLPRAGLGGTHSATCEWLSRWG